MTQYADHIHTPDDGRGPWREVLLNGKIISHVCYADTRAGVIRVYRRDADGLLKLDRWGKRVLTRTLRGRVEVRWLEPAANDPGVRSIAEARWVE